MIKIVFHGTKAGFERLKAMSLKELSDKLKVKVTAVKRVDTKGDYK